MINWLVVGAGNAGRCHMAAITQVSGADLVGVVDPGPPSDLTVPVFDTLQEAQVSKRPDAVVIATPNDRHVPIATVALEAGLPVLCEKPAGRSASDAKHILEISEQTGTPVGVVLNQRTHRHCQWIKSQIESGAFAPSRIKVEGRPVPLAGWHTDLARSGGGVLRTIVLHYIDLLMWWLGPLHDITVRLSGAPVENAVVLSARIGEVCTVSLDIAATGEGPSSPVVCHLTGEGRELRLTGHAITDVVGLDNPPPAERLDSAFMYGPGHIAVIAKATAAIEKGEPMPVPLQEVLPLLECVQDMYALAERN